MLEGEHERFLGFTGRPMSSRGTSAPFMRPRAGGPARDGAAAVAVSGGADRAARVDHLGTETVFAVAAEAAALAAQGKTVYPFHLGDLNIPTPANIAEAATRAMRDGKTTYCPNAGIAELREAIAARRRPRARPAVRRRQRQPSSPAASPSSASSC